MISQARLRANAQNAQKSTGPTTDEGKSRSRQNAVTHGLSAQGPATAPAPNLDDAASLRVAQWSESLNPSDAREEWLVEQMARASVRIDRCRVEEDALHDRASFRAEACWDNDQDVAAEETAARLASDPSRVASRLRQSSHGSAWLRLRWDALARIAVSQGSWNDAQRSLAFDLLGVPESLRPDDPRLPETADAALLASLARAEVAKLDRAIFEGLSDLDTLDRDQALTGVSFETSPPARLLRRYESAAWRVYWFADREFKASRASTPVAEVPIAPAPVPMFEPEPEPELVFSPDAPEQPRPSPIPQAVRTISPYAYLDLVTPDSPSLGMIHQRSRLTGGSPLPNRQARRAARSGAR